MATPQPTRNHARREFTWRARGLNRQLARAELLLEQRPGDATMTEIRDVLAAAIQRAERAEVGAGEGDALATIARLALDLAGGR